MTAMPDVVGGKNRAQLSYLMSTKGDRRDPAMAVLPLRDIGWTMSQILKDMDDDGNASTDLRGVYWLENPGAVVE